MRYRICESPCAYEGINGKDGRFITDFYAAFILRSTTNSFFEPLVNYDRLAEETGFGAWGGKILLLFFRGKNEVVPGIYIRYFHGWFMAYCVAWGNFR